MEKYSTNATVSKIRAMYGKMLTSQDYDELMSKQNVSDVAAYLKASTHYADILSSVETNTIHRGFLESLIRKNNFNIYVKLCKFQELGKYDFYNYELVSDEINQILSCILHINSGDIDNYIGTLPGYLIEHSKIDFIALAKQKKFEGFLEVLSNTPYKKLLSGVSRDENGKIDYMSSELILRTYFYNRLIENVRKNFDDKVGEKLVKNIKAQIDLINIINAFRMKNYFNYPSEEVKKDMLPFNGQMSKKKINNIYESKNPEDMLLMINKSVYAKQVEVDDLDNVEKCVYVMRYKNSKRALRDAQDAPTAFYAYLNLCEVEAQNIISITEGIRYKVSPSYIQKLLII